MGLYNSKIADNKKVEFIMVSKDEDKNKALGWAKKAKLPWLHVLEKNARSSGLGKYDEGAGHILLIDKNGRALATDKAEVKKQLEELGK